MSLALHYWMGGWGSHHCSGPPVSEMTYTVSSGTLNPSIPFLLAYTYLQDGGASVEVPIWWTPRYLADRCVPAHFVRRHQCIPRGLWDCDSTGTAHPDLRRSAQLRRQWTTNMEQSASWTQNTRYDFVLLQASSQGSPVSAVVCAAAGSWVQHSSSGAVVTVQRIWRRL